VVLSSHQLDLVEDVCQTVAIINRGRLVIEGAVENLDRTAARRLAVRVGGGPDGRWASALAPRGTVEAVRGGTVMLRLTPGADTQAVLDVARAAGPLEHFSLERRRLSEIFRDTLGASDPRIAAVVYERAILQTGGRLHIRQLLRSSRSRPLRATTG
jgi:ABC-2 type transport system ATP-binding protein